MENGDSVQNITLNSLRNSHSFPGNVMVRSLLCETSVLSLLKCSVPYTGTEASALIVYCMFVEASTFTNYNTFKNYHTVLTT